MSAAIFDMSIPHEDRYDLVCAYLNNSDVVASTVVRRLLSDDYDVIRSEALDCIIDNREVAAFADALAKRFDDESSLLPRGRVLAGLAMLSRTGGLPLRMIDDIRFAMWVNLSEYISTRNVMALAMVLSRAGHEVEGVRSLLQNMLEAFDDLIDPEDRRLAETIVQTAVRPERASGA